MTGVVGGSAGMAAAAPSSGSGGSGAATPAAATGSTNLTPPPASGWPANCSEDSFFLASGSGGTQVTGKPGDNVKVATYT
ncbi:MAG TPA: hypothetical protein VFH45_09905, partial [Acidimicrobiales bacterium]|nr:hypothetical protein [Acidimicrobiales bacterium]